MTDGESGGYREIRLQVPRENSDAVCNFIVDNYATGMVLEEEEGASTTVITFYLPADAPDSFRQEFARYLGSILAADAPPIEIREREIQDVEWVQQYRDSVSPIMVGDDVIVRPPWAEAEKPVRYDIVIEPKMAFGTGSHETTRGCLKVVRERFHSGLTLLDLGTGSGILAILADKLQAAHIKAVDYDPVAVDNCRENFLLNKVTARHEILLGSLDVCAEGEQYDMVTANIIKSTLVPWMARLMSLTRSGGTLVLSGLLVDDMPEVEAAIAECEQRINEVIEDNAWRTVVIVVK